MIRYLYRISLLLLI